MGKSQRSKGIRGETELANLIQSELMSQYNIDLQVKRTLDQTREGGFDLSGLPYMAVEVKRHEKLSINTWWKQTTKQAKPTVQIPVLAYRQSRKDWKFILPLSVVAGALFPEDHDHYGDTHRMEIDLDGFLLLCAENITHYMHEQMQSKAQPKSRMN